jgi:hypothetical protein
MQPGLIDTFSIDELEITDRDGRARRQLATKVNLAVQRCPAG